MIAKEVDTSVLQTHQKELFDILKTKNEDIATMYLSAIQILSFTSISLRLVSSAHLIRKMMKWLPYVIDTPLTKTYSKKKSDSVTVLIDNFDKLKSNGVWPGNPKWKGEIDHSLRNILEKVEELTSIDKEINASRREGARKIITSANLSLEPIPKVLENSRETEWLNMLDYFTTIAHNNHYDETMFLEKLTQFESILLSYLKPRPFLLQKDIKKKIDAIKKPTKENVKSILDLIHLTSNLHDFFEYIEDPEWLKPLEELGYLHEPLGILKNDEYTIFPSWPPTTYLIKIAPKKPFEVMEIIENTSKTDNPKVHKDFIDAALKMPPEISVKLTNKICAWLNHNPIRVLSSSNIVTLIAQIKHGGFIDESLKLCKTLLSLRYEKDTIENLPHSAKLNKIHLLINEWEYNEIAREMVVLFENEEPIKLIEIFCKNLRIAVYSTDSETTPSHYWRYSIEKSDEIQNDDLKDVLINCLRDLIEVYIKNATNEQITFLVTLLESYKLEIFIRLALHTRRLSSNLELIKSAILNQNFFDSDGNWHEYALLLKDGYGSLNGTDQKQLLSMISKTIDSEKTIGQHERKRYRCYHMIHKYLDEPEKATYVKLHSQYKDTISPEFLHGLSHTYSPSSPMTADELKVLSIEELAKFLDEWTPETPGLGDSKEGLGFELQQIIPNRINPIMHNFDLLKIKSTFYAPRIIEGLRAAVIQELSWHKVISYLSWALELSSKPEISFETPDIHNISWIRTATCFLIDKGLTSKENEIPYCFRNQVWNIILACLSNIPSSINDEKEYYSNEGYYQNEGSYPRNIALETAVYYAEWVKRHLNLSTKQPLPIKKCPEVFKVLESHLNVVLVKSMPLRALYGRLIPRLFCLNQSWFISHLADIFPNNAADLQYRQTAFYAYIQTNHPHVDLYEILKDEYYFSVEKIITNDSEEPNEINARLVDHLICLLIDGIIDIDSKIIQKLYERISPTLRSHALYKLSQVLQNRTPQEHPTSFKNAINFINARLAICEKSSETNPYDEFRSFSYWSRCKHLDPEWYLTNIIKILGLVHNMERTDFVVNRLISLVDINPTKVAITLNLIVNNKISNSEVYTWQDDAMRVLERLLASSARNDAVSIINTLGTHGFRQFGDLLGNP